MSVLYVPEARLDELPPWECSDCGHPLLLPAVVWQRVRLELLHPDCAERKGVALLKDSRECELATNPAPRQRRRAIASVRHRLLTEEAVA